MSESKKTEANLSTEKPEDLRYLEEGRYQEILKGFSELGVSPVQNYQDPQEFSKQLQRVSNLQFKNLIFTTTSSTQS
jgi:hypothetical protein